MLQQLVSQNTLHGWNIFEDRNGYVCLNIRFTMKSIGTVSNNEAQSSVCGTQYRKVSPKQQARNNKRVQAYNESRITRSKVNNDQQKENLRNNDISADCNESLGNFSMEQCRPSTLASSSPIFLNDSPIKECIDLSVIPSLDFKGIPSECHELKDCSLQASPDLSDQSSQTQADIVSGVNQMTQCGVKSKHKSAQTQFYRTSECSVQTQPDFFSERSAQVGTAFSELTNTSSQVDFDQVDASCQVTLDPAVGVNDLPSTVTSEFSHNQTQTPYIWPNYEQNPVFDVFWPNPPKCINSDCRYAGAGAKRYRGSLFYCSVCNIITCFKCKEETGHDYMCEDRLKFYTSIY